MKCVMKEPAYTDAVGGVDPVMLTSFQKQVWKLMKGDSAFGIVVLHKMKQLLKSVK